MYYPDGNLLRQYQFSYEQSHSHTLDQEPVSGVAAGLGPENWSLQSWILAHL